MKPLRGRTIIEKLCYLFGSTALMNPQSLRIQKFTCDPYLFDFLFNSVSYWLVMSSSRLFVDYTRSDVFISVPLSEKDGLKIVPMVPNSPLSYHEMFNTMLVFYF